MEEWSSMSPVVGELIALRNLCATRSPSAQDTRLFHTLIYTCTALYFLSQRDFESLKVTLDTSPAKLNDTPVALTPSDEDGEKKRVELDEGACFAFRRLPGEL